MPKFRLTLTDLIVFAIAQPVCVAWLYGKKYGIPLWEQPTAPILGLVATVIVVSAAAMLAVVLLGLKGLQRTAMLVFLFISFLEIWRVAAPQALRPEFTYPAQFVGQFVYRFRDSQAAFFAANGGRFAATFDELSHFDSFFRSGGNEIGPIYGYHFKIASGQTASSIGGARSYFDDNGVYCKGFGLIAWPDKECSNLPTIEINMNGTMFGGNLGADAEQFAARGLFTLDSPFATDPLGE